MALKFQDLPDLCRDSLVDLAGWAVLKDARSLVEAGAVKSVDWARPELTGIVQAGSVRFAPRLNLRSLTFAENRCNCSTGRQGYICAHAIALCLVAEQRRNEVEEEAIRQGTDSAAADPEPKSQEPAPPRILQSLKIDDAGTPLYAAFLLPPNLKQVAPRNAIMVKLELRANGQRVAPEKIFKGTRYRIEAPYLEALCQVEAWNDGKLAALLQLKRAQLRSILDALRGEPAFAWVNDPLKPIKWIDGALLDVSGHLLDPEPQVASPSAKPTVKKEVLVRRARAVEASLPKPPRPSTPIKDLARMEIDGSPHFLSVRLPSRESPVYQRAVSIFSDAGFRPEPSNGRWWLRDQHKVLNFLAAQLDEVVKIFDPVFTDNYCKRMQAVKPAEISAQGTADGDGFVLNVSINAGEIPEGEIRRSISAGQHYVVRGDQIWLLPAERLQKLAVAQQSISGTPGQPLVASMTRRLSSAQLADVETLLEPVVENLITPDEWRQRSQALKSVGALRPAPVPESLDARLRSYQRIGVAWLWHLFQSKLGGVLADEMGLGKTIQAISLIAAVRSSNPDAGPALVVCPAGLVENWAREAERFAPWLRIFRHHRESRLQSSEELSAYDLVISSYGTVARDQEVFDTTELTLAIADEAQHIKNRRTQAAAALRALKAGARFVLTGTPVENSLDDLRSLFAFILPGYLAMAPNGARGEERAWYDQRCLSQAAPYILRRSKQLVAPELPEKIIQTLYCDLTPAQEKLYKNLREKGERSLIDLEAGGASEGRLRMEALTQLLRLRQVCSDPRIVDDSLLPEQSAKLRAFEEILDEAIDGGHRILVFSQFVSVLKLLRERLESNGLSYAYIDGQTTHRQREVDRFNKDPGIPVFLISLKAGGTGLNLTGADTVVHFDPWWNPAVEAQATDRAHRIGQTRVVTSIKLIAAGTVEEKVLYLQETKAAILRDLLDESAAATAKVSLKDLKSLLAS